MSAVSFQINPLLQEAQTESTNQQSTPAATSAGPSQTHGAAAPQDTVMLSGSASEGQQARDPKHGDFEQNAFFLAEGDVFTNAGNAHAKQGLSVPPMRTLPSHAPVDVNQAQDPNAAAAEAAPNQDAAAGGASAPGAPGGGNSQTPQQELIRLDQTLRQMGINPQTIALFSRMAMLRYSKNPDALRTLVEQMQSAAQQLAGRFGASQRVSTNLPSDNQPVTNPAPPAPSLYAQQVKQLQVTFAAVQEPAPPAPAHPDSGSATLNLKA
ncbi:MAG: hypothetical protein LAN59_12820 [Acidobacteriia bacterium]|nr:hypothetical protein [Terriglobia bacterium]